MSTDYKNMTVVMLKEKIRKNKAKNCPPYSKLNKAGLVKLAEKLDVKPSIASKKVKKSGVILSSTDRLNMKNKRLNTAGDKLDKKAKEIISKIDKLKATKESKVAMKKLISQNPFYLLGDE